MRIIEIETRIEINYYITTDDDTYPYYRRSKYGTLENLMGESWEPVYGDKEIKLEQLFQESKLK